MDAASFTTALLHTFPRWSPSRKTVKHKCESLSSAVSFLSELKEQPPLSFLFYKPPDINTNPQTHRYKAFRDHRVFRHPRRWGRRIKEGGKREFSIRGRDGWKPGELPHHDDDAKPPKDAPARGRQRAPPLRARLSQRSGEIKGRPGRLAALQSRENSGRRAPRHK